MTTDQHSNEETIEDNTYCEQAGKREDSFNKALKHIARVVRSEVWRFIAISMTSTASDSVTYIEWSS